MKLVEAAEVFAFAVVSGDVMFPIVPKLSRETHAAG